MSETVSKEDARLFLQEHPLGVLATTSSEAQPYASPILFIVDSNLNFYFATKSNTKKITNILQNKEVSLAVVDGPKRQVMQVQGEARILTNDEQVAAIEKISKSNAETKDFWPPPVTQLEGGELFIVKVIPTWIRLGDFTTTTHKQIFKEVIR